MQQPPGDPPKLVVREPVQVDLEDELANITKGMDEMLEHTEGDGTEPSRPTSAPPTLDISNQNLFAFQAAFQAEDSFPIISDDSFQSNTVAASGPNSPTSASSDAMSAAFAADTPPPASNKGIARDPRKRTQSIEKFLAQSPGSILGPRKRYSTNATGMPRNPNTGSTATSAGGRVLDSDDPMQYIMESPGHTLRGLRKRLDALNLSTAGADDDGTMQRQLYLQQQQDTLGSPLAFVPEERGTVGAHPIEGSDKQRSPGASGAGTPLDPRSPLHSPSSLASPHEAFDSTIEVQHGSPSGTAAQGMHQQLHQTRHGQSPHAAQPHLMGASYEDGASYQGEQQHIYMRQQQQQQEQQQQQQQQQQQMYMTTPYGLHQMPQAMHPQHMYMHMPGGENGMLQPHQQAAYYAAQHGAGAHGAYGGAGPELGHQGGAQQYVPVGEPGMSGMQKVILPNGVEAMVVPMLPHGMPWTGGAGIPPPPRSAPPGGGGVHHHGSDMGHLAGRGRGPQGMYGAEVDMRGGVPLGGGKRGAKGGPHANGGGPGSGKRSGKGSRGGSGGSGGAGGGGDGKSGFGMDQGTVIPTSTPLEDFKGGLFLLSQEQNGCRYLQQKVDREGASACELILSEVHARLVMLMMDPFGNYLFQKLLEHATEAQRQLMLVETRENLLQAALNLHGTRSVQKFIEVCGGSNPTPAQLDIVIEQLCPHITKMSMDTNGNHVVQRCLQYIPRDRVGFVYDTVVKDVLVITRHRHGCCVFQRCIDAADAAQRVALTDKVVQHAIDLMQDPFGNYVVQYVLEHSQKREANRIIEQLPGRLTQLSMQKFSSNVVEKCLQYASSKELDPLISELCESETMRKFLNDQYANYVVQRALQVAEDRQGQRLVESIRPHMSNLASSNASCARRVSGRVIKRFPNLSHDALFSMYFQKDSSNSHHHHHHNNNNSNKY